MTSDLARALQQLRPGAEWSVQGNAYADLQWLDKVQTKPTLGEVNAVIGGFSATDSSEQSRQASIKGDADRTAMIARLKTATPAQIDAWVAQNVKTPADAIKTIGIILKLIALDARQ